MSFNQRLINQSNRLAAAYGYRVENIPDVIPIESFVQGDGIIVLNKNGEVVNSGKIDEIVYPQTTEYGEITPGWVKVNKDYYYTSSNHFRKL